TRSPAAAGEGERIKLAGESEWRESRTVQPQQLIALNYPGASGRRILQDIFGVPAAVTLLRPDAGELEGVAFVVGREERVERPVVHVRLGVQRRVAGVELRQQTIHL